MTRPHQLPKTLEGDPAKAAQSAKALKAPRRVALSAAVAAVVGVAAIVGVVTWLVVGRKSAEPPASPTAPLVIPDRFQRSRARSL